MSHAETLLAGRDQLKSFLDISGDTHDDILDFLLSSASSMLQGPAGMNRIIHIKDWVEYYDGNGKNHLFLKQFPILSEPSEIGIWIDPDRDYTVDDKVDVDEIVIYHDTGEIYLEDSTFARGRQSVKVSYTAGINNFEIVANSNDAIDFDEGGPQINATIPAAEYTGETLATAIGDALTAAGSLTYTATFNHVSSRFIISATGTFDLLFGSGQNSGNSIADTIGFADTNKTGAASYTADHVRTGLPEDIVEATLQMAAKMYEDSKKGSGRLGIEAIDNPQAATNIRYIKRAMPPLVRQVADSYRKVNI